MKKDIIEKWNKVKAAYDNAATEEDKAAAAKLQHEIQDSLNADELKDFNDLLLTDTEVLLQEGDEMIAAGIKEKLGDLPDMVSMVYISQKYFGKSGSWLSQRINGHKVNGKPAKFTDAELSQLQDALHDIGNKLLAFAI